MNAPCFDALARAAATRLSRRAALKGAAPAFAAIAGTIVSRPQVTSAQETAATPLASPAATEPRIRKNVLSLTAEERSAFVDAVVAIKNTPSPWAPSISVYDQFVFWHREAFDCPLMAAHMGPAIWPWHRMFLLLFEEQLRLVDPSVTLPYWDWTVDNQPDGDLWGDDLMGGSGDPDQGYAVVTGPFRKDVWPLVIFDVNDPIAAPYLVRDLGAGGMAPTLPTAADVAAALALPTYDSAPWNETSDPATSLRNTLEGWRECAGDLCTDDPFNHPTCSGSHDMHNRVHLWVSGEFAFSHQGLRTRSGPFGTMAFNSSPNDPVFFLHHANVDRIWSGWLARHGETYAPESGAMIGHNAADRMWPFAEIGLQVTPRETLSDRALGFVYDVLP